MVILRMLTILHAALSVLRAYGIHYRLHHFLLLLLIKLFLIFLIFFIVLSLQRNINLLLFSLFYDIFNIPLLFLMALTCLLYNFALLRILLPILFNDLFEFDPITNRNILPLINLLLTEIIQLIHSKHSFLLELSSDSFHLHFNEHTLKFLIRNLLIISRAHILSVTVFLGLIAAHRLHGLIHLFLLFLHFYLLAQSFQLIFLYGVLNTSFYDSPSRILWLCGR